MQKKKKKKKRNVLASKFRLVKNDTLQERRKLHNHRTSRVELYITDGPNIHIRKYEYTHVFIYYLHSRVLKQNIYIRIHIREC